MTGLDEQLPHTMVFPHALGTGLIVQSVLDENTTIGVPPVLRDGGANVGSRANTNVSNPAIPGNSAFFGAGGADDRILLYDAIGILIDTYESALSRFRPDSLVSRMRRAKHGGTFVFPDWCGPLFDLYDRLFKATSGAIDPCVGEDLIRLGYDSHYSFTVSPDAIGPGKDGDSDKLGTPDASGDPAALSVSAYGQSATWHLGAIHGRATWKTDVERHGTTLVIRRPVALDFGACGKGYLVDLIARMLREHTDAYVIDAGGDLLIRTVGCASNGRTTAHDDEGTPSAHDEPAATTVTIALEDPADPSRAVGTATMSNGAFCASAPSRRHWGEAAGHQLHHLLNAIDGLPVDDVAATWVAVHPDHEFPTATADGLATALFTAPAEQLHRHFDFQCAILNADRAAAQSPGFPGGFFMH
ncbi:FAD:protein FMN transferase [Bifidobacterium sp. SO4]|uniref:FAD:protein FMN transferase n=1 Tax=Bifidobacterium sp. SO4 TaxID=2809030 RepID=UPI001F0A07FD|nr:FAD:protein FMN transferase [Bifidobacterium sp. SO4]